MPPSFVQSLFSRSLRLGRRIVHPTDRYWDEEFRNWMREARATGRDPNDIGDDAWDGIAERAAGRYYLPHIHSRDVVLELGPGTGRYTRHVIGRCRKMILVDYSRLVCKWLERYLSGRGEFEVHCIDNPSMPRVADEAVDFGFAHGVFEHLDTDDAVWFLEEFRRILKPGASLVFNFDNLMTDEGVQHLRRYRGGPGDRNIFRYYHPDAMARLAETAGLSVAHLTVDESRFAFLEAQKPEGKRG